ncbi:hypothetical protein BH09DEP1_BH09DEP1_3800 [soil metagenome]
MNESNRSFVLNSTLTTYRTGVFSTTTAVVDTTARN